jgi:hypothetical protein
MSVEPWFYALNLFSTVLYLLLMLAVLAIIIAWPRVPGKGWLLTAVALQLVVSLGRLALNLASGFLVQSFSYNQFMYLSQTGHVIISILQLFVPLFLMFGFFILRGYFKSIRERGAPHGNIDLPDHFALSIRSVGGVRTDSPGQSSIYVEEACHSGSVNEAGELPRYQRELFLIVFAIVGLFACLPLAVAAFGMASNDLHRMRIGQKDTAGRPLTLLAYALGIVGTLLNIAIRIVFAAGFLDVR